MIGCLMGVVSWRVGEGVGIGMVYECGCGW